MKTPGDRAVPLTTDRPAIGIIGTGFIATQFAREVCRRQEQPGEPRLAGFLTRRRPDQVALLGELAPLASDLDDLMGRSDVIFECSGDPIHAAAMIERALAAGKPVMTLNPEFHVTAGSALVGRGYLTEADGDQPGCLASLREEAVAMGFKPWLYGNMKGFLNRDPSLEDMRYWGARQGISLPMVTSFTDGTKLQIEQVLAGNGFAADILEEELTGPAGDDLQAMAGGLAARAVAKGRAVTDYVLSSSLPHGVFITGTHADEQAASLAYIKMGQGPYYTLIRPNILVHLEPFKTIKRMQTVAGPLLNNGALPSLSVAAVAKRDLKPGERIERGCGSFDMRGIAVRIAERPNHLPIGLAFDVHIKRPVAQGSILEWDDVDLPESRALMLWQGIVESVTGGD